MVARFLDHNNGELKQRGHRRQQERQKSNRFILAKQHLCTCVTKNFLFLFQNLDTVVSDSTPEKFVNIWQIEWNWIRLMNFETVQIHFCYHPEILLLWQRDVTTSPLYSMVMLWRALTMTSLKTLSNTFMEILKEHTTTVFCKISVRRSKNSLEFSIAWGMLNISRWPFHSRTIFEAII